MRKFLIGLLILVLLLLFNGCTNNTSSEIVTNQDKSKPALDDSKTKIEEFKSYEIVNYAEFPLVEICGEKMTFLGESYEEISSNLSERLMAIAVRFYIEAYIDDLEYIEAYSDTNLLAEIEQALSDTKEASYNYGGNQVVKLEELSKDKKPYFIKAPQKIEENKYLVTMYDSDKTNIINVVLTITSSDEIKVSSFLVNKAN